MRTTIVSATATAPVYDLTTVEAVNRELGLTSDTANDVLVAADIDFYSRLIAEKCNRTFVRQSVTQRFRLHRHETANALWLAYDPVAEIISVSLDDNELDASNYEYDADAGLLFYIDGHWSHGKIEVEYVGGYDLPSGAPISLQRACIDLIKEQRIAANRGDQNIRDLWDGEQRISYFGPQPGTLIDGLPISIANLIAPFKRAVV